MTDEVTMTNRLLENSDEGLHLIVRRQCVDATLRKLQAANFTGKLTMTVIDIKPKTKDTEVQTNLDFDEQDVPVECDSCHKKRKTRE
mmetsp:Transcript_29262/g.52327  ORF Transcript_29262/g.52327 Transcript_29262/m.52327 type:complete len:87 (+) Transcript_29262:825-1085(+)